MFGIFLDHLDMFCDALYGLMYKFSKSCKNVEKLQNCNFATFAKIEKLNNHLFLVCIE